MYWQWERIRSSAAMTRSSTYILELPDAGLLGSLLLTISNDNVSGGQATTELDRLIDFINKVEVITNGSTIVKSMIGTQAQALAFFDQGVTPPDAARIYASETQRAFILLNFGRRIRDRDYGLDLGKFDVSELKVTNNMGSSQWAASPSIHVDGLWLRDAAAGQFKGHLRSEEWRSWTTVANETKYLELPTDYRIRRIILQAISDRTSGISDSDPNDIMYSVKHSLLTGTKLVFEAPVEALWRANYFDIGAQVLTSGKTYKTAGYGIPTGVASRFGTAFGAIDMTSSTTAASVIPTTDGGDDDTLTVQTYTADEPWYWLARGYGFQGCAVFDYGDGDDPSLYLDPAASKVVKLDIQTRNSSGAADGTAAVVLDRLVPY